VSSRRRRKKWLSSCLSDQLTGRDARRRARTDLRRGTEPQPRYVTGKFWVD
jgi:hypothetical protein